MVGKQVKGNIPPAEELGPFLDKINALLAKLTGLPAALRALLSNISSLDELLKALAMLEELFNKLCVNKDKKIICDQKENLSYVLDGNTATFKSFFDNFRDNVD
jgi:hypothetical protein